MNEFEDQLADWPEELSDKQRVFLERFSHFSNIETAARGVCSRMSYYRWEEQSELFRENLRIARDLYGNRLLQEATALAVVGEERPVIRNGAVVKDENGNVLTRRHRSPALLKFLIDRNTVPARAEAGQMRRNVTVTNA